MWISASTKYYKSKQQEQQELWHGSWASAQVDLNIYFPHLSTLFSIPNRIKTGHFLTRHLDAMLRSRVNSCLVLSLFSASQMQGNELLEDAVLQGNCLSSNPFVANFKCHLYPLVAYSLLLLRFFWLHPSCGKVDGKAKLTLGQSFKSKSAPLWRRNWFVTKQLIWRPFNVLNEAAVLSHTTLLEDP